MINSVFVISFKHTIKNARNSWNYPLKIYSSSTISANSETVLRSHKLSTACITYRNSKIKMN